MSRGGLFCVWVVVLLGCRLALGATGVHFRGEPSRVVSGEAAKVGDFPFYVVFQDGAGRFYGSGFLIRPNVVLTNAYHFTTEEGQVLDPLPYVQVWIGGVDISVRSQWKIVSAKAVVVHPFYNVTGYNALALVELDESVDTATADFNSDPSLELVGNFPMVIGQGPTNPGTVSFDGYLRPLRVARTRMVHFPECENIYADNQLGLICAGILASDGRSCYGDAGIILQNGGKWLVVGVVAQLSLKGCAIDCEPDIYTQVSAYRCWILQVINQNFGGGRTIPDCDSYSPAKDPEYSSNVNVGVNTSYECRTSDYRILEEELAKQGGLSTGAIAGIAVGAGLLLAIIAVPLIVLLIVHFRRRRRLSHAGEPDGRNPQTNVGSELWSYIRPGADLDDFERTPDLPSWVPSTENAEIPQNYEPGSNEAIQDEEQSDPTTFI